MRTSAISFVFTNISFLNPGDNIIAKNLMCEQNLLMKRSRNQLKL